MKGEWNASWWQALYDRHSLFSEFPSVLEFPSGGT